jgi:hypothetical protein
MSYYNTLTEDIQRAREILDRGRVHPEDMPAALRDVAHVAGGTIFGVDTYAAYKLLESFVEAIEAVGPKVCELAVRAEKRRANRTEQTDHPR